MTEAEAQVHAASRLLRPWACLHLHEHVFVPVRPCVFARAACECALCICACLPVCVCARARTHVRGAPCFPAGPVGSLLIHGRRVRMCLHGAESSCVSSPEEGRSRDNACPGRYVGRGEMRSQQWGKLSRKPSSSDLGTPSQGLLCAELGLGARTHSQIRHYPCPSRASEGHQYAAGHQHGCPSRLCRAHKNRKRHA